MSQKALSFFTIRCITLAPLILEGKKQAITPTRHTMLRTVTSHKMQCPLVLTVCRASESSEKAIPETPEDYFDSNV